MCKRLINSSSEQVQSNTPEFKFTHCCGSVFETDARRYRTLSNGPFEQGLALLEAWSVPAEQESAA